jgi:hypothetical protein
MAYTAGNLILDDHYNEFVSGNAAFGVTDHGIANANSVWGVGFGDKGWGQAGELVQVQAGQLVSATQWQGLFNRILVIDDHEGVGGLGNMPGDGGAGGPAETTGSLIEAIAAVSANTTQIYNNRLTSIATGTATSGTSVGTAAWNSTSVHTITVEFTDGDAARYFFNAGGNIEISATRSGGGSGEDNAAFDQLLPDINIVRLSAITTDKIGGADPIGNGAGGSGYIRASAIGYHQLTTSPSSIFRQYASGYATTHMLVEAQTNAATGTDGDNGDLITFTVTMDTVVDVTPPGADGTFTVTATVNQPATTFIADSWGGAPIITGSPAVQA